MKRVLCVTRSIDRLTESQLAGLRRIFGYGVVIDFRGTADAAFAIEKFRTGIYEDVFLNKTALSQVSAWLERGGPPPLVNSHTPEEDPRLVDYYDHGAGFRLGTFRRCLEARLVTTEVEPRAIRAIVRYTRHPLGRGEEEWLKKTFGPSVRIKTEDLSEGMTASSVAKAFKASGADELVLVAPFGVYRWLTNAGIYPLKGRFLERLERPSQESDTFLRHERIVDVVVKYEPVGPTSAPLPPGYVRTESASDLRDRLGLKRR